MGVSYLALVEYGISGGKKETFHQFFTDKRAKEESPKAWKEADNWIASILREHGASNVRCTIAKVAFCILG